jgi:hypothetical protein
VEDGEGGSIGPEPKIAVFLCDVTLFIVDVPPVSPLDVSHGVGQEEVSGKEVVIRGSDKR